MCVVSTPRSSAGQNAQSGDLEDLRRSAVRLVADLRSEWVEVGSIGYEEIAAYRNRMLSGTSDLTGRPYARSTINGRLRIWRYLRLVRPAWARERGTVQDRRTCSGPSQTGGHARARRCTWWPAEGQRVDRAPSAPAATCFADQEIRRVMAQMGARDRLIVEWALMTGARRMEIAGLKLAQLPSTDSARSEDQPAVPIRSRPPRVRSPATSTLRSR